MWTFSPLSPKTFGFPPGVWCCQRHRPQNLPGGQDVRFTAYNFSLFIYVFLFPAVSFFCLFFVFCFFSLSVPSFSPLCCHNQASESVWGAECKYSFSLSVHHLFGFVCSLYVFLLPLKCQAASLSVQINVYVQHKEVFL